MTATQLRDRVLFGLAVETRTARIAGARTAIYEAGAGSTVVLLHGGIECGGAYWAPPVPALAERHRVVVPDVPGLGASEPLGRLGPAAFARWFGELVDKACDEPPALVAHSLLGGYAARFAASHPGRLRRLVVYAAPGIGRYRMPIGLRFAAIRADLRPSERNRERFLPWPFLDHERTAARDPAWFAAFMAYLSACGRVGHTRRTMRRLVRTGAGRVPDDELGRIEIPVALLWGRHDRMVPLGLAEEASSRLGWPLEVVEDAGHVPHIEQPAAFASALGGLLGARGP